MINNLSQLKKHADKYLWTMIHHGWIEGKKVQGHARKVIKKQQNALQFEGGSWLYYEKASNFTFSQKGNVIVVRMVIDNEGNELVYWLDLIK